MTREDQIMHDLWRVKDRLGKKYVGKTAKMFADFRKIEDARKPLVKPPAQRKLKRTAD